MTWDLSTIFATEADWESALARAAEYPEKLAGYKGRTRRSGSLLLEYLRLSEECSQFVSKIGLYAHLRADEDTTNSQTKSMGVRVQKRAPRSSVRPRGRRLSCSPSSPAPGSFRRNHPGLEVYKHDFEELERDRKHVLSPEVEAVLSLSGEIGGGPSSIFGSLNNADLKLPIITDENGEQVQLSLGNYSRFLDSKNRDVRKAAFDAMMGAYYGLRNTMASAYSAQVNMDIFRTRSRNYPSCIERALYSINVPLSVYDTLIETVHANLPLLHRYLEMRKRILGVDELMPYDTYVPLVDGVDDNIAYADALETVLAAVAPLGEDYVNTLRQGYNSRWIDVVENKGKRSGAYQSSVYGTNPFMLLNWQGNIDSMFTLAHESGHAMHSFFSKTHQPYTYSGYTLFVAEVASTTNEALLAEYLLKRTTDPKMRLYIINQQLEGIRGTLISQALFAEFERETHAQAKPDIL